MFPNVPAPAHEHCPACQFRKAEPEQPCPRCGWWERRNERQCLQCKGPIIFDTGPGIDKLLGIAGAGTAVVAFFIVGWLGGLALALSACALGALFCAIVTRYRCGMCDQLVPPALLAPEERRRVSRQQTLLVAIALALALVGAGLGWLWLTLFRGH
jgi:NO-binding membrane sensor protein with MHYT domain